MARREDPLAQLLSRATETGTRDGQGFIKGILTEGEHVELRRLLEDARDRYPEELAALVGELRQLLGQLHPMGVLARFTATNLFGFWGEYFEPTATGSEAKVEFVAGMLMSSRLPTAAPDPPDPTEMQRVIDLVDEIFDVSLLLNVARETTLTNTPEAGVRFAARAQWLSIRGPAYPQHALSLAHALFDRYSQTMRRKLGFDLADLIAVESAVTALMETRYNTLIEESFRQAPDIATEVKRVAEREGWQNDLPRTSKELDQWAFIQVWDKALTPALSFVVDELNEYEPSLERETIHAVLHRLAIDLGSISPDTYSSPLHHNPISERAFVRWIDRFLLPVPGIIARDYVSILERDLLESEKGFSRWRANVVDEIAISHVSGALPGAQSQQHLFYPVHEDGIAKWVEVDGLVLFDRVAIIVEGKATPLSSQARRGDVNRARADLRRSITEASSQAERVERYLRDNDPAVFYDENHQEVLRVETSAIQRIHVILPTLHPLSDYGMNPARLKALGLPAPVDAWTVYINDLRIISETVRNAAELLHYLTWRSRLALGDRIHVVDEIDLFGSYLLRQQFSQLDEDPSAFVELTGSSTDFDDFYLGEFGHGPRKKKPRMVSIPLVDRFLNVLTDERPSGWLSAAGTCLDLSLEELAALDALVPKLVNEAEPGEVVWQRFGTFLLIALGEGLTWPIAWKDLQGTGDIRHVVFAARSKKGKVRLVWAFDVDEPPPDAGPRGWKGSKI